MALACFRVGISQSDRLLGFVGAFHWRALCEILCPRGASKESCFFCTRSDTDPCIFWIQINGKIRNIDVENIPYVLKPYGDEALCDRIRELILACGNPVLGFQILK